MSTVAVPMFRPLSLPLSARFRFVLAVILFRVSLDVCYVFYVNPAFESHFLMPMRLDFDVLRYCLSYALVVGLALFLPHGNRSFSGIAFMVAMIFVFVPMTAMYGLDRHLPADAVLAGLVAIVLCYFATTLRIVRVRTPLAKSGRTAAVAAAFCFVMLFVAWSVVSGAVANISFDLTQIYTYREIASGLLDVGLMSYVSIWAQKVFNPFLLAYGLYRRNNLLVLFAIVMQIYFFGVTQHRIHLFVPVLVFMVYWLYALKISIARLYLMASAGVVGILVLTLAANLDAVAAIVLRRAFFVPASAAFDWVAYFADKPKVLFADNLLEGVTNSAYTGKSLPFLLGDHMAPGREISFNSGIIGAGFAQVGLLGVAFYAIVLGWIIKFVNSLIRQGVPVFVAAALLIAPIRTAWADSDLFTALLSHGIVVSLVVLWLLGGARRNT